MAGSGSKPRESHWKESIWSEILNSAAKREREEKREKERKREKKRDTYSSC